MRSPVLLLSLLVLPPSASALHHDPTVASGYVTALASPRSFSVEGASIRLEPDATYATERAGTVIENPVPAPLYLGEFLRISGRLDRKAQVILATRVLVIAPEPAPISGIAIIDQIPSPSQTPSGDRIVRADGYLLHLTPRTGIITVPPLYADDGLTTNLWIEYSGTDQGDGSVLVDQATLRKNLVRHTEDTLRNKGEFDPASVTPEQQQGSFSRNLVGLDPKRLPAVDNPELAARIDRIGQSLVPAYQRSLDPADPTRIHFRFQVVDLPKHPLIVALPSGIMLVPKQFLDRLTDDSQIAALLAQCIATAIEKDDLRFRPTKYKARAASLAGLAADSFVPGVALATSLAGGGVEAHVLKLLREQRDRVSLCLLNDAGYDLSEAPVAFWLLAPEKPASIDETPLPQQAAHLYQLLATNFRTARPPLQSQLQNQLQTKTDLREENQTAPDRH